MDNGPLTILCWMEPESAWRDTEHFSHWSLNHVHILYLWKLRGQYAPTQKFYRLPLAISGPTHWHCMSGIWKDLAALIEKKQTKADKVIITVHCMDPPIPEYQCAILIIKWEIGDLNGTGATVDGRRQPVHRTIVGDQHISIVSNIKLSINTVKDRTVDNKCYSPSKKYFLPQWKDLTYSPGLCQEATLCCMGHGWLQCRNIQLASRQGDNPTIAVNDIWEKGHKWQTLYSTCRKKKLTEILLAIAQIHKWRAEKLTISIHTLVVRVSSFSFCGLKKGLCVCFTWTSTVFVNNDYSSKIDVIYRFAHMIKCRDYVIF